MREVDVQELSEKKNLSLRTTIKMAGAKNRDGRKSRSAGLNECTFGSVDLLANEGEDGTVVLRIGTRGPRLQRRIGRCKVVRPRKIAAQGRDTKSDLQLLKPPSVDVSSVHKNKALRPARTVDGTNSNGGASKISSVNHGSSSSGSGGRVDVEGIQGARG